MRTKSRVLASCAMASILYPVAAWYIARWIPVSFVVCLGALVAARLAIGLTEASLEDLHWRLFVRRAAVQRAVDYFRLHRFPARRYRHHDLSTYLLRLHEDTSQAAELRVAARRLEDMLVSCKTAGAKCERRTWMIMCDAFEIHSPEALAPAIVLPKRGVRTFAAPPHAAV